MRKIIFFILLSILFSSCFVPVSITHKNEVIISLSPLSIDTNEYAQLINEFGLEKVEPIWNEFGGLSPRYPIAFGIKANTYEDYLFAKGCMYLQKFSLLVKVDTTFVLLNTQEKLKNFYAPIENEEEALSYAVASTGFYPLYDIEVPLKFRKYKSSINTTYVVKEGDNYEVQLFYYQVCGCGPHYYYAVILNVNSNGEISEPEFIRLYKDPSEDRLCVD